MTIDDETKRELAGIYLLKKMDLKPKDGGMTFPIALPTDLAILEDVLHQLALDGYIEMNTRKDRYDLTKAGIARIGKLIEEGEQIYDDMEELEDEDVPGYLAENRLDPLRTRFLWGWYEGELDDLVLFQERRGIRPIEKTWSLYLMSDEFWQELAKEVE